MPHNAFGSLEKGQKRDKKMALPAFIEAMQFMDVVEEIGTTEWGEARGAFQFERKPTFGEAVAGIGGIGGLVGAEPALKAIVKSSMSGRSKTRAGTPYTPPKKRNINHTQSNLQSMTKRAGTDGDEVPVMPIPKKVARIHPDYFTVNLPHITRIGPGTNSTVILPANVEFAETQPIAIIRLNSIFDSFKNVNATSIGTDDDPILNRDRQPQGRDIWASHFKFYRVIKADVKITWISTAPASSLSGFFNHFVVGYELTDEDGAIADNAEMFMMTKRAAHNILKPAFVERVREGESTVIFPIRPSVVVQQYTYRPESWNYHVEEQGSEERWTPIGANPSIDHDMQLRMLHLDDQNTPANGDYNLMVQINYTVQFREATDSFFKVRSTATAGYPDAEGEADD